MLKKKIQRQQKHLEKARAQQQTNEHEVRAAAEA